MSSQTLNPFVDTTRPDTRRPALLEAILASGEAADDAGADWRYEKKYFLNFVSADEVELLLKHCPRYFRQAYPDRYINNVYLDSHNLRCFHENIDGVSPRFKQRVRWYGDLHKDKAAATLEIKRKYNTVGDKLRLPLGTFDCAEAITGDGIAALLKAAVGDRRCLSHGEGFRCVLVNRYLRRYFATFDERFRVTVDRELQYFPVGDGPHTGDRAGGLVVRGNVAIVEIKYAKDLDRQAREILQYFPFRPTRISKYVYGVDLLRASHYL